MKLANDFDFPLEAMLRHMLVLGSSGSGKTVLCKIIAEEFALKGLPVIAVDPQGDIASLIKQTNDISDKTDASEPKQHLADNVEVVIWTPSSDAGVPMCVNPMKSLIGNDQERLIQAQAMAGMVAGLLGYDLGKEDGEAAQAIIADVVEVQDDIRGMDDLEDCLRCYIDSEDYADIATRGQATKLQRRLARANKGAKSILFNFGAPMDIETLLGLDSDKTRISVIYLNTLSSQEEKEFYVAALAQQLYDWMLDNPNPEPQCLVYLDELAPYLPPIRKPACKPALTLLLRQARKYGVCMVLGTQSPGDLDYKALGQVSTWAIGKLTLEQDIRKVTPTVEANAGKGAQAILDALPDRKAGQFTIFNADHLDEPQAIQARWLYTAHETLDEDAVRALTSDDMREEFYTVKQYEDGQKSVESVERAAPEPPKRVLAELEDILGMVWLERAEHGLLEHFNKITRDQVAYLIDSDPGTYYMSLRHYNGWMGQLVRLAEKSPNAIKYAIMDKFQTWGEDWLREANK